MKKIVFLLFALFNATYVRSQNSKKNKSYHYGYEYFTQEYSSDLNPQVPNPPVVFKVFPKATTINSNEADSKLINFRFSWFRDKVLILNLPAEGIDFTGSTFDSTFNAKITTFQKKSVFTYTNFKDRCAFFFCVFESDVDFRESSFEEPATFDRNEFNENVTFSGTIFKAGISFSDSFFKKKSSFKKTTIRSLLKFTNTSFDQIPDFNGAILPPKIVMESVTFNLDRLSQTNLKFDFRNSSIENSHKKTTISLNSTDVSKFLLPFKLFEIHFKDKTPLEEKISTYEQIIKSCEMFGMKESVEGWTIEYEKLMNLHNWGKVGHLVNYLNEVWWNFGFSKWRILFFVASFVFPAI